MDHVKWVLSVPFPLSFLFASQPAVMCKVLGIIYRIIATHLTHKAGFTNPLARTGAVTLIQRFGGTLNLKYTLPYVVSGWCVHRRCQWTADAVFMENPRTVNYLSCATLNLIPKKRGRDETRFQAVAFALPFFDTLGNWRSSTVK
jgi:hypothetical protein